MEPLAFKRGIRVYFTFLMAAVGLNLPPLFAFEILFDSFVHPQICIEHLLRTMGHARWSIDNSEPPS